MPRWYPSAMIMANGSMMIVGGEIGSNDAEQPTLELLPATGVPEAGTVSGYSNTTVYLDFLQRTAPFNLYPFVCVVPSGIFIAYYNEARILDEGTFETIKTLPNMPAAVNDPTGGRTYQLEGSMVLLPQYAPYTENLGVLICGGSTSGGGYPIDNCVSTRPEDPDPVWTIERMVRSPLLTLHHNTNFYVIAIASRNALHGRSPRRNLRNCKRRPTRRRRLRSRRRSQLQRRALRPYSTRQLAHEHHGQHIRSTPLPLRSDHPSRRPRTDFRLRPHRRLRPARRRMARRIPRRSLLAPLSALRARPSHLHHCQHRLGIWRSHHIHAHIRLHSQSQGVDARISREHARQRHGSANDLPCFLLCWHDVHDHRAAERPCGASRLVYAVCAGWPHAFRGPVH